MLLLSFKVIAILSLQNCFGGIEAMDGRRSSDSFSFNRGRGDRITEQGYLFVIFFHSFCDILQIFNVKKFQKYSQNLTLHGFLIRRQVRQGVQFLKFPLCQRIQSPIGVVLPRKKHLCLLRFHLFHCTEHNRNHNINIKHLRIINHRIHSHLLRFGIPRCQWQSPKEVVRKAI